jgi:hypothetical protein
MPDGNMPLERAQFLFVEHLRNQTHLLVEMNASSVGYGDAGALLTSML